MSDASSERPTKRQFPSPDEARELLQKAREKYVPHPSLAEIARTFPPYQPPGPDDIIVVAGLPPSRCSAYQDNADWLPPAFVQNATCACEKTPDEPSANAVRFTLQDELAKTNPVFKERCRVALADWDHDPLRRSEYEDWVAMNFAPVAYEWHMKAYASGCCPCGPAPFIDWVAVCTIPIPFCRLVEEAIDWFGSCHCTPGKW
jgi:hypothetical protein